MSKTLVNLTLQNMKLNQIHRSAAALFALVLVSSPLHSNAQDKAPAVNPAGTWEVRTLSPGSHSSPPQTLKLKLENGKLTGTLSRPAGSKVEQLPLEGATLSGTEISFAVHTYTLHYENNVLQPTDTNKVTRSTFKGKIHGDTIKGKVEKKSWQEQLNRTQDWEARRVKGTAR
jgi:hypothetical protein